MQGSPKLRKAVWVWANGCKSTRKHLPASIEDLDRLAQIAVLAASSLTAQPIVYVADTSTRSKMQDGKVQDTHAATLEQGVTPCASCDVDTLPSCPRAKRNKFQMVPELDPSRTEMGGKVRALHPQTNAVCPAVASTSSAASKECNHQSGEPMNTDAIPPPTFSEHDLREDTRITPCHNCGSTDCICA
jgi:hypothetical protein